MGVQMIYSQSIAEGKIDAIVKARLKSRVPCDAIHKLVGDFYVGGNSLNAEHPNDIDVYPCNQEQFLSLKDTLGDAVVYTTKNATTAVIEHRTVQFCNYYHTTLAKLISSFDFAHVQIGAKVTKTDITVEYTDNWLAARATGNTYYTGSEYPISSLVRIGKYIKRDNFNGRTYINDIVRILTDILNRGIRNYDDFKDQLDAIDLGLLSNENKEDAMALYRSFQNIIPAPFDK